MGKNNTYRRQNDTETKDRFAVSKKVLFIAVLVVTNIFTVGFIFYNNRSDAVRVFNNPFPLVDMARSFLAQEHFLSTIKPARKEMKQIVSDYEKKGNRIGVYFEFLNTGANVSINQDERFWPASLSKMPTVFAVMKKVEEGEWKLTNELVLFSEDQDGRFGELYKKTPGTRFTIEELLKETLINSDNTAHSILVRNLSSEDYTDIFEALGMEELFDQNYDITAKEYSRIFRSLYTASYLNRENSQKILKWLSETKFNEFLGAGVPPEVLFSHKIGEEFEQVVFLDSGIIYIPNRPVLITVMVEVKEGGDVTVAQEIMRELSKAAYTYVANN
ncbi:MAG: class A beta-lactamase-related serine hydrolase [Candidatus Roizmanbacteria bacterium]|nr:class A beta-lactamase-related serine hydrolase [Candidatus Roizmanbacteria bacterium]